MGYPVKADGKLSPGEVFRDMTRAPGEDGVNGVERFQNSGMNRWKNV